MMNPQQKIPQIHVTVAAIIEKKGKFLLVEEFDPELPGHQEQQTFFNQPAGHVEPFEGIVDAVIRETLEETAWEFIPLFATGIYHWQHPNGDSYIRHCFYGEVKKHDALRQLDTGIVGTHWLSKNEIRQQSHRHRSPLVVRCIEDYLSGQHYPLHLYHNC